MFLLVVLTAGAYLPSPLYPEYQQAFGFSDLTLTLVYAMFALVTAPALLLFGSLSDAFGVRPALRASIAAAMLGSACFAFANGPAELLLGRAAHGLALGAATGAATALIIRHPSTRRRLPATALASVAFLAGTAIGPVAAGVLAQNAPAPRTIPYLIHLALLVIGWWAVSGLPPAARRGRWRPAGPRIPAGNRLLFTSAAANGFLAWTVAGLFLAVIPSVLARTTGIDNPAVTGAVVGAVLVCSVLAQPFVPRCGPHRAQLLGLVALATSLILLALSGGDSLALTTLAAIAGGLGNGLAYGGATAAVIPAIPDHQQAGVNSALYLAFYLGSAGPAIGVGLLTLWYPLQVAIAWLSMGAAVLVPVAILLLAAHTMRRQRLDQRGPYAATLARP